MESNPHRTKYTAQLDIRYGVCVNELNERLLRRVGIFLNVVSAFSTTAIFISLKNQYPVLGLVAGSILTLMGFINSASSFADKRAGHHQQKKAFAKLNSESEAMSLDAIDARLRLLQAEGPDGLTGLDPVAYNRNVCSHGQPEWQIPLSWWSRILAFLV
ncbi:hypothetical protein [Burkholderia gladioli]|uniref:hypothetical protein n=1 Tax=Burkholderia gladioli TaxID=28095 RepID=UPI0016400041|nr:hypothetical protein [Burkholderia gladioli]